MRAVSSPPPSSSSLKSFHVKSHKRWGMYVSVCSQLCVYVNQCLCHGLTTYSGGRGGGGILFQLFLQYNAHGCSRLQ